MITLNNSFLNPEKSLVKTLDGNLYGIWNNTTNSNLLEPVMLHIFTIDLGFFVAIDALGNYVGISLDGSIFKLSSEIIEEYKNYIIKGDICNCDGKGCVFCEFMGFKENKNKFKSRFPFLR